MYEWNEAIQKMIDWLEDHLAQNPSLEDMAKQIGYSPFYSSAQFHSIVGMPLKTYVARRRLGLAALAVRDTDARLLDIALRYGYASQQALTRAFTAAYGCTPAAYRRQPVPIPLSMKKAVLFPAYYTKKGAPTMNETVLTQAKVRVEYIPAHAYISVRDSEVQAYFPFWERHNCDEVTGTVESMRNVMHPIITCHTAGWFWENGKRGYSYGTGVAADYDGVVPEGFEIREFPGSYYLVFYHPTFDFLKDSDTVVERVEELAWQYDPAAQGFCWNETVCQDYQRMECETVGYEVLRPVCRI